MKYSKRNNWSTPIELFNFLKEFIYPLEFTIDAAASIDNHKVERYWTIEDDALIQDWSDEIVFCNPPFCRGINILNWLEKGKQAFYSVFILPVRTDNDWFSFCLNNAAEIYFLRKRVQFIPPDISIKKSSNNERTMIVIFNSQVDHSEQIIKSLFIKK